MGMVPHRLFSDFITILNARLPDRFKRSPRKLSPAQVVGVLCLMTGFGRKGYRRVVAELKAGLHHAFGWPALHLIPSPQAIGQARQSLSRSVCDEAFFAVRDACTSLSARPVASYHDLRLLSVDGTRLSLPPSPALIDAFGVPKNQHGQAQAPMAGLVQIWDVGRNCPVAFSLTTCDHDEREEAESLLDRLGPKDLLIGDRGYPSYAFFRAICRRRARFLIRIPIQKGTRYGTFAAGDQDDVVIKLTPPRAPSGRTATGPAIPIRLVRITLANGATEVLATNLWRERGHEREALAKLYTQRWRIETAFREMKVFHALEEFSATYPDGIYQEITAIQIFLFLTSELEALARQHADEHVAAATKRDGALEPESDDQPRLNLASLRFNRLLIADNVVHLLRAAALGGPRAVAEMMPEILSYLWKNRSYAKSGRSYPRQRKRPLGYYRRSGG